MKRRSISFTAAVILLILFMFTACAGTKESEKAQSTPVPTEQPGIQGENTPAPTEQPEVTTGLSRPLSDGINPLERGRALQGLSVVGEDSPYYCNLEENMLWGEAVDFPLLLCPDPVYGITYYVNYGRDYFIYALRDGVSEPAVEAPARELYCKDGELYFLLDSYGLYKFAEAEQGNILKYNPTDGRVEVVIDAPVENMAVYPNGIYYRTLETTKTDEDAVTLEWQDGTITGYLHYFYYSFAEQKIRKGTERQIVIGRMAVSCWKGSHLVQKAEEYEPGLYGPVEGVYLENSKGEFVRDLENIDFLPRAYLIKGDCMYYAEKFPGKCSLMCYNLETGEKTVMVEELGLSMILAKFIIHDDVVHFADIGGDRLIVFLTRGRQAYIASKGPTSEASGLFTDGEELYGVVGKKLWRMSLVRNSEAPFYSSIPRGYNVDVMFNTYEYRLYPIGEE